MQGHWNGFRIQKLFNIGDEPMERDYSFDPTFGVKSVAFAIAQLIDFTTSVWPVYWSPFYNGRERGICLTVGSKAWVFGEIRNSDGIYLDRLENNFFNPPCLEDLTAENYINRQFFRRDEVSKVAEIIKEEIRQQEANNINSWKLTAEKIDG